MPYNYGGGGTAEFDLVPEGIHEFFIDSITEKQSKNNRLMVEVILKPSDISMQKYGKVWHYIMLDNEFAEVNVGRFLSAVGRDPQCPARVDFADFKGEYLEAEIRHQNDERYGAKATVRKLLSRFVKGDVPNRSERTSKSQDGAGDIPEEDIPF